MTGSIGSAALSAVTGNIGPILLYGGLAAAVLGGGAYLYFHVKNIGEVQQAQTDSKVTSRVVNGTLKMELGNIDATLPQLHISTEDTQRKTDAVLKEATQAIPNSPAVIPADIAGDYLTGLSRLRDTNASDQP